MENGPNYHSYTFKIDRTTPSLNAPVENLLFTPLPDGSYEGFWIVYDLSETDKQKISNGEFVNVKDRSKVTKIESISFSTLSKNPASCTEVYYYPTLCVEHLHLPGEPCAYAGTSDAAQWVQVVINHCPALPEVIAPTPGDGNGSGGGGGKPPPEPCVISATNPGSMGLVDGNGCIIGAPTNPNLGSPPRNGTPCENIKKTTDDAKFIANKAILETKGNSTNEVGYKLSYPIPNTGQTGTQEKLLENFPGTGVLNFSPTNFTFAYMHSHKDSQYPIFSPDDLVALNIWIAGIIQYNSNPNTSPKVNLKELTVSVVTTWGTYLMSFDGTTIDAYPAYTKEQFDKLNNNYLEYMIRAGSQYGQNYMENIEEQFLRFIEEFMPMPDMKLFRVRDSGNTEIYLENGNRRTKVCS